MADGIIIRYGPKPVKPDGWYRLGTHGPAKHWWEVNEAKEMFRTLCGAHVIAVVHQSGLATGFGMSRTCQQCSQKRYNTRPIFQELA